jgi:hypothetical protein
MLRRVEKTGGSAALRDEAGASQARFFERRRSAKASRFETRAAFDGDQNGPSAHFAAQVLGQVLNAGRNHPAASGRLYARASIRQREKRIVEIA